MAALVHAVADTLASRFAVVAVRGELSAFSRASSGHCYFCLKDADGQAAMIRCAMFRRAASLLDFAPADGQRVELRGRLAVYEPRGELQFVVESMQRAGAGTLYEQFLRLKAKLEAEGLFDPGRKRPLPQYPRRVAVVTSLQAAALHDVASAFARRAPHVEVRVYPSPVQGPEAPPQLVAAIARAVRHGWAEVLVVCRGGGSLEDLWAFNDERVVRAIASCALPVVCGVGHETDVTLADFAADLRAPTPTAAAELVAPATDDCAAVLEELQARLKRRVRRQLDAQAQRLDGSALRLARPTRALQRQHGALALLDQRLAAAVRQRMAGRAAGIDALRARLQRAVRVQRAAAAQRLDVLQARLARGGPAQRANAAQRLEWLASRLASLDPQQVLARGYAWLEDADGAPVQSVARLQAGQPLKAVLADGAARVVVDEVVPR